MPANTSQALVSAKTAVDVGVVSVGGYFMGMPIDAMILGAMAGAMANGMNAPEARRPVALAILVSMMLSGAFAPVLTVFLSKYIDLSHSEHEIQLFQVASPVLIGGGWSWFAPLLVKGVRLWWDNLLHKIADKISEKADKS